MHDACVRAPVTSVRALCTEAPNTGLEDFGGGSSYCLQEVSGLPACSTNGSLPSKQAETADGHPDAHAPCVCSGTPDTAQCAAGSHLARGICWRWNASASRYVSRMSNASPPSRVLPFVAFTCV